jgi:hypothetical protein
MIIDADGMARYDMKITREGKGGTRVTKLYEMHEQEVALARNQSRIQNRRGDTVTIKVY